MRQSLRLTIAFATAVVVALNLLAVAFVVRGQQSLADARQWVTHTYSVLHEIETLNADRARRSTTVRGYLMGGGDDFLKRSRDANQAINDHLTALRNLTSDDREQQKALDRLAQYQTASETAWRKQIDNPDRQAAIAASIAPETIGPGLESRAMLDGMEREERRMLDTRWQAESIASSRYGAYAVWMAILSVVSIIGALRLVLDQLAARTRAEEEMRGQSEMLRAAIESLDHGIAVFSRARRLLMWNQRFVRLHLSTADRIQVGAQLGDVAPADAARVQAAGLYERSAAGDVVLEVRSTAMPDGGLLIAWSDISARHRMERLKNEFVSTVSHELRTPLTSIIGSLGLVRGGIAGPLPAEAASLLEVAHRNGERLVGLINDILDTEKIESGRMDFNFKTYDLMEIVRASIEANSGYSRQYQVTTTLTDVCEGARVSVDGPRLEQVLANLLSNAAKFSRPGATVEVGVQRRAGRFLISVRDHGAGVPEAFQSRLFEKFAQADSSDARVKGGTGLGLFISRMIMERLGGTIGFTTGTGQGSTFTIELPEAAATASASVS